MNEKWFSDTPVSVFIDNCIFRSSHFNFLSPTFITLRKAVDEGDVEIVVTTITQGEFIKHSEVLIRKDETSIRKAGALRAFLNTEIDHLLKKSKEINGEKAWESFKTEFKVKNIDSNIDWKLIFSDYFSKSPPFSSGKKHEFPDAFNIKLLENLKSKKLIILSTDSDYVTWANGRSGVSIFQSADKFIDAYLKLKNDFSQKAIESYKNVENNIISEFKNIYTDTAHYTVSDFKTEIVDAEVIDLNVTVFELVSINIPESSAIINIKLHGRTNLSFLCEVSTWDSIDKEEVSLGSNEKSGEIEIVITASVTVFVPENAQEKNEYEIIDHSISFEDFDIPESWTSSVDEDNGFY